MFPKSQSSNGTQSNQNLDNNISSINDCEKQRVKICNEFKKLNERLYDINSSEKRLLDDLSNSTSVTNHNPAEIYPLIERWKNSVTNNCTNRQDLITIINKTMIEPLNKFHIAVNEIKNAIKRYEQLTNDCHKYAQKVQKYKTSERTSSNLLKLNQYEQMLEDAQKDCSHLSQLLQKELPMFLQRRIEYFQPSLTALISSQIYYFSKISSITDEHNLIDDDYSIETPKHSQTELFNSIDSLSIVNS